MPFDVSLILIAIVIGAALQVGISIGFSIIAGPLLMLHLGTQSAVPMLLLLNIVVSVVAVPGSIGRADRGIVMKSAFGCIIGIGVGIAIYPKLTETIILGVAGTVLIIGAMTTLLPIAAAGKRAFLPVSGLAGLATVLAAMPGPLMALGLILSGHPMANVRKLVQPIAMIGYCVAFALHASSSGAALVSNPLLLKFLIATVIGSLVGRLIGPKLPKGIISNGIRLTSLLAGLILLYRSAVLI